MVVNDFGELNVDASLVAGQIDEPASIAGGCICCLPDDGGLDEALAKLADPARRLDAILVEASGLADPVAIARIIGFSKLSGVRPGGLVDVIDAVHHFDTVDRSRPPPARYGAASLVVVNKLDQVPEDDRRALIARVEHRVAQRNPRVHVVGTTAGRIDPALLFDPLGTAEEEAGQRCRSASCWTTSIMTMTTFMPTASPSAARGAWTLMRCATFSRIRRPGCFG